MIRGQRSADGKRERSILFQSVRGVVMSFTCFALAILGIQSIVDTLRGFQVADPRTNNCAECTYAGFTLASGPVASTPKKRLDFGASTTWEITRVSYAGRRDEGPNGERDQIAVCTEPFGSGTFTTGINRGYSSVTFDCAEITPAGKTTIVYWAYVALDWTGVKRTQRFRGASVTEENVSGTYYYKSGFSTVVHG